jgi:hypothetical protein
MHVGVLDNEVMLDHFKQTILHQFEAALWMLNECIEKCPEQCWSGPGAIIGKYEFWHVAYHTLYCTDYYFAPSEAEFRLEPEFYPGGEGDFENEYPSRMMTREELKRFLEYCLTRLRAALAAETESSLSGPSGFNHKKPVTRSELYLYSMRHVMHHVGMLSAFLRRNSDVDLKWGFTGWPAR